MTEAVNISKDQTPEEPILTPDQIKEKARANKPRVQKLEELANPGESIYVQNQLDSIVVYTCIVDGQTEILEFAAKGDPYGKDFFELPATYLRQQRFKDNLRKKILKIVTADNDAVADALDAQEAAWEAQQETKRNTDLMIERQQPKAFSGVQCLANEGRHQCSEFAVYSQNSDERPPLCAKHAYLASQFIPDQTGEYRDGKPVVEWRRVGIMGR